MKSYGAEEMIGEVLEFIQSVESLPLNITMSFYRNGHNPIIKYEVNHKGSSLSMYKIIATRKAKKEAVLRKEVSLLMEGLSGIMHSGSPVPCISEDFEKGEVGISFCPEKVEPDYKNLRKGMRVFINESANYTKDHEPKMKVIKNTKNNQRSDINKQFI